MFAVRPVAETVESSPKRVKVEEVERDAELVALSATNHLTAEEGRSHTEPHKAILRSSRSRESKEPEMLLMEKSDKTSEKACKKLLTEKKKTNFEMFERPLLANRHNVCIN